MRANQPSLSRFSLIELPAPTVRTARRLGRVAAGRRIEFINAGSFMASISLGGKQWLALVQRDLRWSQRAGLANTLLHYICTPIFPKLRDLQGMLGRQRSRAITAWKGVRDSCAGVRVAVLYSCPALTNEQIGWCGKDTRGRVLLRNISGHVSDLYTCVATCFDVTIARP